LPDTPIDTDPFWTAALDKELRYRRCVRCAQVNFYPRGHCTRCGSREQTDESSAGNGSVYSYTIVRLHPEPFFAARVPYISALIELDEGFFLLSELLAQPDEVAIGSRVKVTWEVGQSIPIPLFVLDE
jgi:uncharacterized OB-fold protein